MNKYIVTTSIYPPSEATQKFAKMRDWTLIVVGDLKTPHDDYRSMGNVIYLDPDYQEDTYPELSTAIGWNKIMRRNIGFVEAYKRGATIIASVDDDNIPYDTWGKHLRVGEKVLVDIFTNPTGVVDPLLLTTRNDLWHRGFPIEYVKSRDKTRHVDSRFVDVEIQVDLWDGDPDIDAICRMVCDFNPDAKLDLNTELPFTANTYIPFNSQNTFFTRRAIEKYMVIPHVGRMDDIWGGYIAQYLLNVHPVFFSSTVFQERNPQSVKKNFQDEMLGYLHTADLLKDMSNYKKYLPDPALRAYEIYLDMYETFR